MSDAPRRWWNVSDKACGFRNELTDVVMCCTQPKSVTQIVTERALHEGMAQKTSHFNRVCDHREMQQLRECWIPLKEAMQIRGRNYKPFFADDLFGKVGTEMEQRVLARLTKNISKLVQMNGMALLFTGQRIRWMGDLRSGPSIDVSQE